MKYFRGSYIFTIIALITAWFWSHHAHLGHEASCFFIIFVLSVLEISLSFDNAVINAAKLEKMSPLWQHRFLTWGIVIAVFGMRFLFPVLVVSIFSHLNFIKVVDMALNDADKYAHYLHISHPSIITFGGAFLLMLFLNYFFNPEKEVHWIKFLEHKFKLMGEVKAIGVIITLLVLFLTQNYVAPDIRYETLTSGIWGIAVYLLIDGISCALEKGSEKFNLKAQNCPANFNLKNTCFINFLYLELIDASFSLDGVLGAFALSKDIVIITLGLAIGAMFVRSLTIMLVEKKTLKNYIYLEHGAHYAIGALAILMFISSFHEVNEVVTGLVGLVFIIAAFVASVRSKKA